MDVVCKYDGVNLAKRLIHRDSTIGIVFVSRYFGFGKFRQVERRVPPTARVRLLQKASLANASVLPYTDMSKPKIEEAKKEVREVVLSMREDFRDSETLVVPPRIIEGRLDGLDVDGFGDLPKAERIDIVLSAQSQLDPYLAELFQKRREVDWIAIGLPSGEVLKWGSEGEPSPKRLGEVRDLAKHALSQCVPVTFHRPRFRD